MSDDFKFPAADEHTWIAGHTGSGKTQLAAMLLAKKRLMSRPHIIIDYKRDDLLNSLERTREIGFEVPKKPGLYIMHNSPHLEDETEAWLWEIWEHENVHLYIDEGFMIPQGRLGAFDSIQVQGRSKKVSVTTLTQRPVQLSRFVVTQAMHIALFQLTDDDDVKRSEMIVPKGFSTWVPPEFPGKDLPRYHARWYSVKSRQRFVLRPVPDAEKIRASIDGQLEPKLRWL